MKLYFSPAACSLSPHIVLREAGLEFDLAKVDLKAKKTMNGDDFLAINPKGYVPALALDDGSLLTEGPAIVQYIADQKPESGLAPKAGTIDRVRLQEWLNFISTELHKGLGSLFNPAMPADYKAIVLATLAKRLAVLEAHLAKDQYLLNGRFSVADAYAFTILNWTKFLKVPLDPYPHIQAYVARIAARPAVQEALKAEGLTK